MPGRRRITALMLWWMAALWGTAGQDTLRVGFAGDLMIHAPQLEGARQGDAYDFYPSLRYLRPLLDSLDAAVVNLEAPLVEKHYAGYPRFGAPVSLAAAIRRAGFTHVVTANNHAADRGREGLRTTARALEAQGLAHTGSGPAGRGIPYMEIRKGPVRLAVLNYTYGTNGYQVPAGYYVNRLDSSLIRRHVHALRRLGRWDDILVVVHWGTQYTTRPSAAQKRWEKFFRSLGIRWIIGSHPHVVQPVERDKQNNRLTAYSLGNLLSNQRTFPRDGGMLLEMTFVKQGDSLRLAQVGYRPLWVYKFREGERWRYEVLPVTDFWTRPGYFDSPRSYRQMLQYYRYLYRLMKTGGIFPVYHSLDEDLRPSLRPAALLRPSPLRVYPYVSNRRRYKK